jgi:hypothetical protein
MMNQITSDALAVINAAALPEIDEFDFLLEDNLSANKNLRHAVRDIAAEIFFAGTSLGVSFSSLVVPFRIEGDELQSCGANLLSDIDNVSARSVIRFAKLVQDGLLTEIAQKINAEAERLARIGKERFEI